MTSKLADERDALPSASRMTRIFNCPASFQLNKMEMPESSTAAEEGSMLHRVCELTVKPEAFCSEKERAELAALVKGMDDEQAQVVKYATSTVLSLAREMEDADGVPIQRTLEERLWEKGKLFSGKGDVILFGSGRATIIDYKFGRGEVEPAERNYQLSALAVLVHQNFGLDNVRAMIIQPRALEKSKRITECTYGAEDLELAEAELAVACRDAVEARTPRQSCGYWCKYCPSSYRCNAAQNMITKQLELAVSNAGCAVNVLSARRLFENANLVKKYCDDVISSVKKFVMENPDAGLECGLELKPGARRPKLGDADAIFQAVEDIGILQEEFVGVCNVEMGKLTALYHEKRKAVNEKQTKKASEMQCRERLENAQLLTYAQSAPVLKLKED